MAYTLVYHPDIKKKDIPAINRDIVKRIERAIETRLSTDPHRYGAPLRRTLKGYWKLRVGDYREPRCPIRVERCKTIEPPLEQKRPNHHAACHEI